MFVHNWSLEKQGRQNPFIVVGLEQIEDKSAVHDNFIPTNRMERDNQIIPMLVKSTY